MRGTEGGRGVETSVADCRQAEGGVLVGKSWAVVGDVCLVRKAGLPWSLGERGEEVVMFVVVGDVTGA